MFLLYFCFASKAQTVRTPISSAYTTIGAYSKSFSNALSFTANQASLASISTFSAGLLAEKRFLVNELSFYQAGVALPVNSGVFGFSGSYFGSHYNNEIVAGLAYGRNLGSKLSIGAQFNYYTINVAGYGSSGTVNVEAGALLHLTENFKAGLHVYNPTGSKFFKQEDEKLPAIYSMGFGYETSEIFFLMAQIQKVQDRDINVSGAMQYKFDPHLFARAGFASATSSYFLGIGILLKHFRLDATASVHPQLGFTPGIMMLYQQKEK
ncbi:MAG: hypothetical protein H0V91_07930 [Flavisolibacter sp.]|nr:hypothetical protein [Flavisolibacter sp.]